MNNSHLATETARVRKLGDRRASEYAAEGRVDMFEFWESEEALAAWRAATEPPPRPEILDVTVLNYQISSSGPPF